MMFSEYVDCTRPFFESSDLILHNIADDNTIGVVAFGNAEPLRRRLPGLQHQRDWDTDSWSAVTCEASCPFTADLFAALLSPEQVGERCNAFAPTRITYLLRVETDDEHGLARRIHERFPDAAVAACVGHDRDDPIRQLVAFSVDR